MSPDVMLHVGAGALGIVAGAAALIARKGERMHRKAGTVFFAAMLATALSAVVLAVLKDEFTNAIAGALTTYFIITSWLTVKRAERTAGWIEVVAMLCAAAGSAAAFYLAWDSVQKGAALLGGLPFYIFSAVAALCALLDFSVILRRGLAGRQRIARHLWRMCLGLFIAVASILPGQLQFFPDFIQTIEPIILLFVPAFSVLAVMLFWLGVALFTRKFA